MCNNKDTPQASTKLLLTSVESFCDGENKQLPGKKSLAFTLIFLMSVLVIIELTMRQFFVSIQHLHPILEDETSRNILARHIGVDTFSGSVVSYLGWRASHINQDMIDAVIWRKSSMSKAYENRLFKYEPECARLILCFLAYQLKNMVDTIIWDDGLLFVAHHLFSLAVAFGALIPGAAQYYSTFYLGFSEVSTAILCLLANFDDIHGVKGLGEALPLTKVILGGVFAAAFIVCRVLMWSAVSYYFIRDTWSALKGNDPRLAPRKTYLRFLLIALSFLTLLQIFWLGEIFRQGKNELESMGLL